MSLDIQQQHFKMNSDFWPQARGPPASSATNLNFPSMMDTTSADYLNNTGRNPQQQPQQQQQAATGFHNNNNNNNNENNNVDMKEHLMSQSTDQNLQNNFNTQASGFSMSQQQPQPNGQAQPQQQQQPPPSASPGAENSSPESKFNADKLVNEIQVSFL